MIEKRTQVKLRKGEQIIIFVWDNKDVEIIGLFVKEVNVCSKSAKKRVYKKEVDVLKVT